MVPPKAKEYTCCQSKHPYPRVQNMNDLGHLHLHMYDNYGSREGQ